VAVIVLVAVVSTNGFSSGTAPAGPNG
jgi:hypothetical protein